MPVKSNRYTEDVKLTDYRGKDRYDDSGNPTVPKRELNFDSLANRRFDFSLRRGNNVYRNKSGRGR